MRFDVHTRVGVRRQLDVLAAEMANWETQPRIAPEEVDQVRGLIQGFEHSTNGSKLSVAGVDGSGDYPAVSYGDSFVYVTVAQATTYRADSVVGLREVGPPAPPVIEFAWVPENETRRRAA